MDLRDAFACQAMNGFISACCAVEDQGPISEKDHAYMAKVAYKVADCMLEARKTSDSAELAATTANSASAPCQHHLCNHGNDDVDTHYCNHPNRHGWSRRT